jgi:hypothetical protein
MAMATLAILQLRIAPPERRFQMATWLFLAI